MLRSLRPRIGMAVGGQENLFGPFSPPPILMFALALTPPSTAAIGKPHFGACFPKWSGARLSARIAEVTVSRGPQIKVLSMDQQPPHSSSTTIPTPRDMGKEQVHRYTG